MYNKNVEVKKNPEIYVLIDGPQIQPSPAYLPSRHEVKQYN